MSVCATVLDTAVKVVTVVAYAFTSVQLGWKFWQWLDKKRKQKKEKDESNTMEMGLMPRGRFVDRVKRQAEEAWLAEFGPVLEAAKAAGRMEIQAEVRRLEEKLEVQQGLQQQWRLRVSNAEERETGLLGRIEGLERRVPPNLSRRLTTLEASLPTITHRHG
ncbi:hypothetical protein FNAPI_6690 [Fusarium napiforme]|uniref:Uncharacterized protein n=1 Tax=Fusarium napiforme TaxID=42672 RepID=A0A8H5N6K7_9HYPO|nr:hypothetical protein FNAPI_6690 [Fusarium napiforme]